MESEFEESVGEREEEEEEEAVRFSTNKQQPFTGSKASSLCNVFDTGFPLEGTMEEFRREQVCVFSFQILQSLQLLSSVESRWHL